MEQARRWYDLRRLLRAQGLADDVCGDGRHLQSKGPDVYYERRGRGAAARPRHRVPARARLLRRRLDGQVPAFERDHRLLLVDLPGHYRSPRPAGRLTVDTMADAVGALLARLGEPPAHVVGLSLGGCVALRLRCARQSVVRSLTLVNAVAACARPVPPPPCVWSRGWRCWPRRRWSAVAALVARGLSPGPSRAALYEGGGAQPRAHPAGRVLGRGVRALARFDVRTALARVRCPTLVMAGADDATVALDVKESLAQAIAGSRWVIVPDSGHATNADNPDAFTPRCASS